MKRILAALCLLISLTVAAVPAAAHGLSLVAAVSLSKNEVTVRLLDAYGTAVEGGTVTVAPVPLSGKPGKKVALKEVSHGTYRVVVTPPAGGGAFDLLIEVGVLEDRFRLQFPVEAGETRAEQLMPMQALEAAPGFNWGPYLYLSAAIVLITATAVAVLRRRSPAGDSEQ